MSTLEEKVDKRFEGRKIREFLKEKMGLSSRLIKGASIDKRILVNNNPVKMNYVLKENDEIVINLAKKESQNIAPEKIDLDIVYEDKYLLIINKESGMVTHPAPGHYTGTLVNALLYKYDLEGDTNRPGIVHRLDKDTSGLMVVAKDSKTLELLSDMMKHKKVKRHYLALVEGIINHETGTIDAPIGRDVHDRQKMAVTDQNSKEAITHFKVLKRYKDKTLIECILDTGRTHQIRVHMKYIKHPVVNDPLYNKKKGDDFGQMLHSKSIEFTHPITGEHIYFEKEPPKEFIEKLEELECE